MRVFSFLRTQLAAIGILRCGSTEHGKILSIVSRFRVFGVLLVYLISTSWYLAFEARGPLEYAVSSYFVGTVSSILLMYLELFWDRNDLKRIFADLDSIVEKSKRHKLEIFANIIWYEFLSLRRQIQSNNWTNLFQIKWQIWTSFRKHICYPKIWRSYECN